MILQSGMFELVYYCKQLPNDCTYLNGWSVVGRSTIIEVGSIRSAGTVSFGNIISDRLGAVYIKTL